MPGSTLTYEDFDPTADGLRGWGMAALGVARADDRELLEGANVDPVVTSLEEVDVEASAAHRLARRAS